ncbi:MAG: response regulator [Nitrospira sp.]|jgi:CheY-like chemotaxis protein|nr:MAG: response regulator [Nitrospira sp.]
MVAEAPRILLADDEDTFRRSTCRLFEQEGYRCDCAQDSQEASRLLTKEHDALISDIRMPGNMQFEFLRDIRSRFPMLPIVLVTGYPSVQTAIESLRLSFTDYLLKPVDWPDLRRAVVEAVKKTTMLRMTAAVREEAKRLVASLEHLNQDLPPMGSGANGSELAWSLDTYLSQSFTQMAILSDRLRAVLRSQLHGQAEAPTDVCRMMECPRLTAYRGALEGTVEVLAKTKHSFRSKELGLLRAKLEQVLHADE